MLQWMIPILLIAAGPAWPGEQTSQVEAARGVLERLIPEQAGHFRLEMIPLEDGRDVFEIESRDGRILIRGSSGVALCSALNWYLKYHCKACWSWCGVNLDLPDPLPQVKEKIHRVSPHRYRYFFNYCCFGYSLAWWDWSQWERMIDWMAMNGINMPLAVTGQEAVWQGVLRRLGFSTEQIQAFIAGPPYLPFGWMGCLDGWGGPLPQDWIDRHQELQEKILARERSLGMTPVLQGFTGHVPPAVQEKFPDARLHRIQWADWETCFLDPLDPLFKRMGSAFIEEQIRLFGTDHLYAADTFIEMTPPSEDPVFLSDMGKAIHGAMQRADQEAVWVMQGWAFFFNARFWQPPRTKAFLGGVPDDRMILLDLFCEQTPMWNRTEAFHGKPWIWSIIQNFGNTVYLGGPLPEINRGLHAACQSPDRGRMSGIGMIQEGLGYNPAVFDLMTEMTWRDEPVELEKWIQSYAERRYGTRHPEAEAAWSFLSKSVYSGANRSGSLVCSRPFHDPRRGTWSESRIPYNRFHLARAWEQLIECSGDLGHLDTYRFDLANVSRQALSNLAGVLFQRVADAHEEKDREKLAEASQRFLQLFNDLDALLATRKEFLLGRWLEDAKRWGQGDEARRRFEWNARNVITLWGGRTAGLHDYARKEWSGLIDGFYLPRWRLFLERLDQALAKGETFDQEVFTRDVQLLEEEWTHRTESYPAEPSGETVAIARKLFQKYRPEYESMMLDHLAVGKPVKASGIHFDQVPEKAVDGIAIDRDSGWWADPYPQWLEIDLEEVRRINGVHLYFYWDGVRYYHYTVEVSKDGQEWSCLVDERGNETPATSRGSLHRFDPVEVRHVKVNLLFNSANTGVHLAEIAVLGANPERGEREEAKKVSLAGEWGCELDPEDAGESEKWFERELPRKITLPGSLAENDFGDDVSVDTRWTGRIVDRSWFTEERYAKYRQPGSIKIPFWLTPKKHYVGPAWFERAIRIPEQWEGKHLTLFLERCHWETRVWVDGRFRGFRNSLSTPHEYDLTGLAPGRHRLTLKVDNRVKIDVGINAHSVSDHTQTNWNGVIGRIELRAADPVRIRDVQVYPDPDARSARVRVTVLNTTGRPAKGTLTLRAASSNTGREHGPPAKKVEADFSKAVSSMEVDLPMGEGMLPWNEFSPALYRLSVALEAGGAGQSFFDEKTATFGMRKFEARSTRFFLNGRPVFLRGTLECCIFPLTGYPPTDVDSWLRILKIAKAHGLNHLRFHSWCPPEAAFEAADRMGFIFQVECGAWTTVGDEKKIDGFIFDESLRILDAYGNHPSFCMMAYGNEPGGARQKEFLGRLIESWKQRDPRRLYTSAAGWPIIPENQFHSTPQPRVHHWGAGLRSRFNAKPPETVTDYRDFVSEHDAPVVSHEIGQWCVYPNFEEIGKYTGVLEALNFEIFRDGLEANHMLDQAEDFLMASGKLQTLCYKEEIESALRTPGFGGFQLLDLHDFPGQGTALVGVLDPFWDSKGYVTAKEFSRFCGPTVPLARMSKRVFTTNETFTADLEIAHFGPASMKRAFPFWRILDQDGKTLFSNPPMDARDIPLGGGIHLGKITVSLHEAKAPQKLKLVCGLANTSIRNDWDFWIYPPEVDTSVPDNIFLARELDEEALAVLEQGGKVLLIPEAGTVKGDGHGKVPPGFSSIFWNTAWTRRQAPHTLGILCDPGHQALAHFPTDFHSNWQWWDLVVHSQPMILDALPPSLRPIVQVIDDWFTHRRLGLLFEARVGAGKLMVCSIDLVNDLEERPVARQMRSSLLAYMKSEAFAPGIDLDAAKVQDLLEPPPLIRKLDARVMGADSEAEGHPAAAAIDGDPDTVWHTAWGEAEAAHPHEIRFDLGKDLKLSGFTYLPRQDMANGRIADYAFHVSRDGTNWSQPVSEGRFPDGAALQTVRFEEAVLARFIRMVAYSEVNGRPWTSIAELDVLVEPP